MFALFFSLYYAMFSGTWNMYSWTDIFSPSSFMGDRLKTSFNTVGSFLTSIFNDSVNTYDTLGTNLMASGNVIGVIAFVLALITSIGIVVVATKGIKKIFTVFFYGVR